MAIDRYVIVETKEKFHSREKRGLEFAKTAAPILFPRNVSLL